MSDFSLFESRQLPEWFRRSKLGIFIHWGAYSVPAWAEPIGPLGAFDPEHWFRHNPYAEWYANTIRIEGSPAQEHHRRVWGGAPYDELLDAWDPVDFDPDDWCALFAAAGASHVVPTTKHHDGIPLWDAPGTDTRNTVQRGPRRDLVGDITRATRAAGMRVGLYYSGGLDWHVADMGPLETDEQVHDSRRPKDAAYHEYAMAHVRDLMDRYDPDVLWNDINWPDAGKNFEPNGLGRLFTDFYAAHPDGLVNDRWGDTHRDYFTTEYEQGRDLENRGTFEHCRGIGYSFGYNTEEDESVSMSGPEVARLLVDVVSRGGRLLLNVGPTGSGSIPDIQRRTLTDLAAWQDEFGNVLADAGRSRLEVSGEGAAFVKALATAEGDLLAVDTTDGSDQAVIEVDGTRRTVSLPADRPGPVIIDAR
ncbi:alpha-L-fucosidase [Aestuariimicrobium ganziense]|uniref:alpha-L-fucosidase n=1 Tax=Aestuariimicrobium ganziense TaxID=2773677 RepID=UPI001F327318|nr:alpha-L-fucosidase [Aestuariimicrobium ganziense]